MLKKIAAYYDVPIGWLLQDRAEDGNGDYIGNMEYPDNSIEWQLLRMFNKLPDMEKYKVMGYIERIYIENMTFLIGA